MRQRDQSLASVEESYGNEPAANRQKMSGINKEEEEEEDDGDNWEEDILHAPKQKKSDRERSYRTQFHQ